MYETWLFSTFLTWIIVGCIFGVICGKLAEKRGYGFWPNFALGFFLCVIGVIIVLVREDKAPSTQAGRTPAEGSADELMKYKKLLDSGAISEGEFEEVKSRILQGLSASRQVRGFEGKDESETEGGRNPQDATKRLLVASIAMGAFLIAIVLMLGGANIFFALPIDESYAPIVPSIFQASALSVVAGILLRAAFGGSDGKVAYAGLIISAISLVLGALGVLYVISTCVKYEASPMEFFGSPGNLLLHALGIACVTCQVVAAYKFMEQGKAWGMQVHSLSECVSAAKKLLLTPAGKKVAVGSVAVIVVAIVALGWVLPQMEMSSEAEKSRETVQEIVRQLGRESSSESEHMESIASITLMSKSGEVSYVENWPSDTIVEATWVSTCFDDEIPSDFVRELNALFGEEGTRYEPDRWGNTSCYAWRDVDGAAGAVADLSTSDNLLRVTWFHSDSDLNDWIEANGY